MKNKKRKCEIITIANRKGGVAKTFTTFTIGTGLALLGYKVLLIDLDSQSNLTYNLNIDSVKGTMYDVITGALCIDDVIVNGDLCDVVCGGAELSAVDITITGPGREYKLKEAIEPLKDKYDFIFIDTPPALDLLTVNALTATDSVIIPAQADIHSIQGIIMLNDMIDTLKKYTNPNIYIKGILITRYDKRAILNKDMKANIEELAKTINTKVFKTPIRENVTVKEAQATKESIFIYSKNSNGAKDYKAVIDELLNDKGVEQNEQEKL